VKLLRTYKGLSPEHPKYTDLCKEIMDSSSNGRNLFPLSIAHLHETIKRTKLGSRKDLLKFIFNLSKFFAIRPWVQVLNLEIRNAILKSLNKDSYDLSDYVFDNELGHCFGSKAEFKSIKPSKEIPKEIKEEVFSAYKNPELMADALCKDPMIDYIERLNQQHKDLTDKLEELRREEYGHPDKKMRQNINKVRFFLDVIQKDFIKIAIELRLNFQEYTKQIFSSRQSADNFLKSIPTAYVFFILNNERNLNTSRSIEPNDFWDLGALAIAVPYCDVVITERMWTNILNQKKIGELYNTKISHQIDDLSAFI
jgi:hypothetical protein